MYPALTFNPRDFLLWNLAQPINNRLSAADAAWQVFKRNLWNEIKSETDKQLEAARGFFT